MHAQYLPDSMSLDRWVAHSVITFVRLAGVVRLIHTQSGVFNTYTRF